MVPPYLPFSLCSPLIRSVFQKAKINHRGTARRSRNQRRTEPRNTPKTRKCGNSGCCFSHIWRISRFSSSGDPRSLRTTSAIAVQRKKKLRLKNFCSNCFIFPYCTAMHTEISRACPAGSSRPRSFSSSLGGSSKTHVSLGSHLP